MLHDLHAYKTGSYDVQANKGAELAGEILEELGITDEAETDMICSAIYHKRSGEMKRRFLAIGLGLSLVLGSAGGVSADSFDADKVISSGKCGDDLTWTLDSDGTLIISGIGEMYDYGEFYAEEWESEVRKVIVEDGVTKIGDTVFSCCSELQSVTFPEGLTEISNYAFFNCESLAKITIPESVKTIGSGAFCGCSELTDIRIPAAVTHIDHNPLIRCSNLKTIQVDENNEVYDSRQDCNAIIETGSGTLISGCASTTIPDGVTKIGDSAFLCMEGLTEILIPKSVTSIGSFAFDKCPNLTIYGYPGSAAEEHAKDYEIPFVKIEELINIKKATVSGIKSKTYTGKKLSQSPRVVLNGAVLQKNVDYKLTYADNRYAGTATVKITGIGKYGGSIKKTFTIKKAANTLTVKTKAVTAKASEKTVISKASAFTVSKAKGTVTYQKTKGNAGITVTSKGKITVKKGLKKGKTYSVSVKVTAAGTANYKKGSETVTLKIKIN